MVRRTGTRNTSRVPQTRQCFFPRVLDVEAFLGIWSLGFWSFFQWVFHPIPPGVYWVIIKEQRRSPMRKIKVLLVDDHTVVRQGLRALLAGEEDMDVVGEAENGRQAVGLATKTPPDVVVMDVALPLLNGLEATRQILRAVPTANVLVLSSYG